MNARPLWIAALLLLPTLAHAETAASDPKAVKIADQVMQALGGKKRFDDLGGLRWSFEAAVHDTVRSSRRHAWDRRTGWYRVEGKNRAGQPFVFMKKLGTDEGHAWMNGNPIEGDSLKTLLKRAEAIWVNDSYWFLMPYKMRDPGVTLKYDGEVKEAGGTWDRIAMSFENVGLTPGDHYWVFVNRKNHRVEKWQMVLQGHQPPPDEYTWEGWEEHDELWFPTAHKAKDGTTVYTRNVATSASIPATEFSAP